jgi:predicted ATPase
MIETLSLRNFKVLRSVDVRLRPLTLIVGPNSSGKSTLLEALDYGVRRLVDTPASSPSMRLDDLKSRLPKGPVRIKLSAKGKSQDHALSLAEGGHVQFTGDRSALGEENFLPAVLDIDVKKLAEPSPGRSFIKTLPADGSFLAWILASLHLEAPGQFSEIVERLRSVVPVVQGLRIRPTALESTEVGYELLFDMKGGEGIPARHVSEGTLVTLALLAVLAGPNPPGLVLIENLERGLHPKALRDLVDQIRLLQKQNPRLQVVATSHSPYLLDYVEADEILLTSLDEDGYASVKLLSDHPDYDRWKDVMAPGEFWSTVGESWVVQKR